MFGLTDVAARSGRLRPLTVNLLIYAPLLVFGVWSAWLLWRMGAHASGFSLWPFELAVAVVFWLAWIAIVATVVTAHEQLLRLFKRGKDDPPDL
jgi:hypothetical protein